MQVIRFNGKDYPLRWQFDGGGRHSLVMVDPKTSRNIAELSWLANNGTILQVRVGKTVEEASKFRRHGIATALLRVAREREPCIKHSSVRTNDGEKWARSLGDPLPERSTFRRTKAENMKDHVEALDDIQVEITDPDPIVHRQGVKHAVHFHVLPNHTTTISLTNEEIFRLYRAVERRVTDMQLKHLARLSDAA